ncbi:ABC transporter permease [Aestuariispira insulae]|uniref:Transport permease protein n=1 Tax=Aestuariispira insulae TaxID=1461337 RepID=A0A3D9HF60_9PROT|nr:ABC transporter permease [Aestuariispira insulae]RED48117.1 ABC-2 type transport system permease protein [Aestuariispira insulae]
MIEAPRKYGILNQMGVTTFIRRELAREWRFFRYTVFGPALQAALFAAVFLLAAGDKMITFDEIGFLEFLIPGMMMSAAMQKAFESGAFSLMDDKLSGQIGDFLSAPFNAFEWLLSYTVSTFVVSALTALTVWGALCLFGTVVIPQNPLLLLGFFAAASIAFTAFGILSAIISDKWDSLSAKEVFILAPLVLLSGSFFPLNALPGEWQIALLFNPIFYMIDGFRYAMTGYQDNPPELGMLVAWFTAIIMWVAAFICLKRGYRIKS